MIAVTTTSRIDGYEIVAYKGTAQGATFEDLLKSAESLGANAILNTCYDDALDVDTLFHGAAVVIEPRPNSTFSMRRPSSLHGSFPRLWASRGIDMDYPTLRFGLISVARPETGGTRSCFKAIRQIVPRTPGQLRPGNRGTQSVTIQLEK